MASRPPSPIRIKLFVCARHRESPDEKKVNPRHPPTYYLPPDSIKIPLTRNHKQTYCEVCTKRE